MWGVPCTGAAAASALAPSAPAVPRVALTVLSSPGWSRGFWGRFPRPLPSKAAAQVVASLGGLGEAVVLETISAARLLVGGFPSISSHEDGPASHLRACRLDLAVNVLLCWGRALQNLQGMAQNFLGWLVRFSPDTAWERTRGQGALGDSAGRQQSPGRLGAPPGVFWGWKRKGYGGCSIIRKQRLGLRFPFLKSSDRKGVERGQGSVQPSAAGRVRGRLHGALRPHAPQASLVEGVRIVEFCIVTSLRQHNQRLVSERSITPKRSPLPTRVSSPGPHEPPSCPWRGLVWACRTRGLTSCGAFCVWFPPCASWAQGLSPGRHGSKLCSCSQPCVSV